jgi:chromosome segregation ATPase
VSKAYDDLHAQLSGTLDENAKLRAELERTQAQLELRRCHECGGEFDCREHELAEELEITRTALTEAQAAFNGVCREVQSARKERDELRRALRMLWSNDGTFEDNYDDETRELIERLLKGGADG